MPPYKGWSSWNAYSVNISEDCILDNAREIKSLGLDKLGYDFVNIDDGFFAGRDEFGNIIVDTDKFPNGMRFVCDEIRGLGLRPGIYSDAGKNTCSYYHNGCAEARGCGLEEHEEGDIKTYLRDWNCDMLKVDWCGGWMRLNQKNRYTLIGEVVKRIKPHAIYNVCSWGWPGEWVTGVADCWRVSKDLEPKFSSILNSIGCTENLHKYSAPDRWNDLDMLQVGNGMSHEQDRAHFSMWCMLNTPLVVGTDLARATVDTVDMLRNKGMLTLHQDPIGKQAVMVRRKDGVSTWAKLLADGSRAFAVLNETAGHRVTEVPLSKDIREIYDVWTDRRITTDRRFSLKLSPTSAAVFTTRA